MNDPIRRDPRLVPLSHDHHAALARARDVVLALDGTVPQDPVELARNCHAFFDKALAAHFDLEERHLMPPFTARVGADDPLVRTFHAQHAELRTLSAALDRGEEPVAARLDAWGKALSAHVRFEERKLFPRVQEVLSSAELDALGAALERHGPSCGTAPPPQ